MNISTFNRVCDSIFPPGSTRLSKEMQKRALGMCVYKLASGCTDREVATLFGFSGSTANRDCRQVVQRIRLYLSGRVRWPLRHEIPDVKLGFYRLAGLPGCVGAIDCAHVPIRKPDWDKGSLFALSV